MAKLQSDRHRRGDVNTTPDVVGTTGDQPTRRSLDCLVDNTSWLRKPRPLRVARTIALIALAVQLLVLVFYSHRQYDRFDLSTDFATYNQAVWMIAHGHLTPWSLAEPDA